jgi:hypothetical protein
MTALIFPASSSCPCLPPAPSSPLQFPLSHSTIFSILSIFSFDDCLLPLQCSMTASRSLYIGQACPSVSRSRTRGVYQYTHPIIPFQQISRPQLTLLFSRCRRRQHPPSNLLKHSRQTKPDQIPPQVVPPSILSPRTTAQSTQTSAR